MPSGWAIAGRSFNFPIKRPKSGGKNPCYEPSQCGQNSFVGPLEMNGVQWPLRQRGRIFKIGVYDSSAGYSLTISLNWKRLSISTVNQRMGPTWTDVQQLLSIKKNNKKPNTEHSTSHEPQWMHCLGYRWAKCTKWCCCRPDSVIQFSSRLSADARWLCGRCHSRNCWQW